MAFSPENLEIWVDSREYPRPIQTASYPPFTKGKKALGLFSHACCACSPRTRRAQLDPYLLFAWLVELLVATKLTSALW